MTAHDAALRLLAGLRVRVFAALRPLAPSALGGYGRGDLLRRFVGDVDGVQDGLVRAFVPLSGAVVTAAAAVTLASLLVPAAGLVLGAALLLGGAVIPWLVGRAVGDCGPLVELAGRRDARSGATVEALPELLAYGAAPQAVAEITRLDDEIRRRTTRSTLVASAGVLLSAATAAITLPAVLFAGAAAVQTGRLGGRQPRRARRVRPGRVRGGRAAAVGLRGLGPLPRRPGAGGGRARRHAADDRPVGASAGAAWPRRDRCHVAEPGTGRRRVHRAPTSRPAGGPWNPRGRHRTERMRQVHAAGGGPAPAPGASAGALAVSGADGGVALSELRAADLPPMVAGSLQGDHVFDATLRDNLRVVRPQALDAELDDVARRAGLAGFVATLPMAWSTPAGPDGAALSGGQRQRLLLARALLADPQVLVLDEPTAHLDAVTERAVLDDLFDATSGRTVLMSTHRRLLPGQVDSVLRMAGGVLVCAEQAVAEATSA